MPWYAIFHVAVGLVAFGGGVLVSDDVLTALGGAFVFGLVGGFTQGMNYQKRLDEPSTPPRDGVE